MIGNIQILERWRQVDIVVTYWYEYIVKFKVLKDEYALNLQCNKKQMILLFEYKIWADSNHIAKRIIVTISSLLFYKDKKSGTNEIYLGYIFYYVFM